MAKAKVKTEYTPEETAEMLASKKPSKEDPIVVHSVDPNALTMVVSTFAGALTSHQFENAVQIAARFKKPGRYMTARKAGIPVELLTDAEYARVVAEIDRRSPACDVLEVIAKSTWDGVLSE